MRETETFRFLTVGFLPANLGGCVNEGCGDRILSNNLFIMGGWMITETMNDDNPKYSLIQSSSFLMLCRSVDGLMRLR